MKLKFNQRSLTPNEIRQMSYFYKLILKRKKYNLLEITTADIAKWRGDLEGLLKSKNIDVYWTPIIADINNISNLTDLDMKDFQIKIPTIDYLNQILTLIKE